MKGKYIPLLIYASVLKYTECPISYWSILTPERTHKTKKTEYFLQANVQITLHTIFQSDSFFLNFLISPKNRIIEPLMIQHDEGHPLCSCT